MHRMLKRRLITIKIGRQERKSVETILSMKGIDAGVLFWN